MSEEELAWALQQYRDQMLDDPNGYMPDDGKPDPEYGAKVAAELIMLVDARED